MSENSLPENYNLATAKKRIGAFVIDDLVVSFLFFVIFLSQISHLTTPEEISRFIQEQLIFIVLIKIIYHTFFVWQNGKTLGKHFMKIRVIYIKDNSIPPLQVALLRASLRIMSETIFYIGFIMAFFNPFVQTLHDKLSNCVVVDA